MREVSLVRQLSQAADRNMHTWYAEYTALMTKYKAEFDADVACTNPEYLQAKLDSIKLQVAKVSAGANTISFIFSFCSRTMAPGRKKNPCTHVDQHEKWKGLDV